MKEPINMNSLKVERVVDATGSKSVVSFNQFSAEALKASYIKAGKKLLTYGYAGFNGVTYALME